jgi:hypothetical protein
MNLFVILFDMSRYTTLQKDGNTVAYGFDIAEGYFFQLFSADHDIDEEEKLLIDESSLFTNMTNGRMLKLLTEFDCGKEHRIAVALDLPI